MGNDKVVLVADDSEDDFVLLKAAFRSTKLPHRLVHVLDGNHAIMYLEGVSPFSDRQRFPFPDLLVLDIQMPNGNGFEVLATLRERPEIQLPVVMFSASNIFQDVQAAAELGAIDFFTKPISLKGMKEFAKTVDERWLRQPDKESTGKLEGLEFPNRLV